MSRTVSRPFSALLSARKPRHGRKPSSPRRRRRLWALEGLEDRVLLAATLYTVNAITDTGAGSGTTGDLLYCIDQANANPNTAGSVIEFDPTVFGTPQTITLSSTLTLSETAGPEVISGPGASLVTVSGNNAVGVFSIASGVTATLTGLTISNGSASYGGGIDNAGTLTVISSTIDNNSAIDGGGGIDNAGTLTVTDCTIADNAAGGSSGTVTLDVSAYIDGRDDLIIQGNTLQWNHFDFAAPGRLDGVNDPTIITTTLNGVREP